MIECRFIEPVINLSGLIQRRTNDREYDNGKNSIP